MNDKITLNAEQSSAVMEFMDYVESMFPACKAIMDELCKETPDADVVVELALKAAGPGAGVPEKISELTGLLGFDKVQVLEDPDLLEDGPVKDRIVDMARRKEELEAPGVAIYGDSALSTYLASTGKLEEFSLKLAKVLGIAV